MLDEFDIVRAFNNKNGLCFNGGEGDAKNGL